MSLMTWTATEHFVNITKGFHILLGFSTLATHENYMWSFKNNIDGQISPSTFWIETPG